MRIKTIITLLVLFSMSGLFAQSGRVHLEIGNYVNTSDADISEVLQLWQNYLNSSPDSCYANPFWSKLEQQRYQPFDLVPNTWWNPSLYQWLTRCRVTILSVSKVEEAYLIRTMIYYSTPNDSGKINVFSITQTGARKENGVLTLSNALPINTRYWTKEQIGSIKFVFPPEHPFNRARAERMNRFIDSLATLWQIPVMPVEYYFADDLDRVAKALGFDYYPAEGNAIGPRGFTDSKNRIIYSGGSDEWYPHEFIHIYINPLFPNAHPYFLEGYATLLGGSGGHDLSWHIRQNIEYLNQHPGIDALTFKGVDMYVPAQYFIGGLLCKMAEEKGGLPLIRKLMTYGSTDEALYEAIQNTFGIAKENVNAFLRKKMVEYATK
jgi:hypothetical protein